MNTIIKWIQKNKTKQTKTKWVSTCVVYSIYRHSYTHRGEKGENSEVETNAQS